MNDVCVHRYSVLISNNLTPAGQGNGQTTTLAPVPIKSVAGHDDELATRECVICSLVIYIDDDEPDGVCPYVERRVA